MEDIISSVFMVIGAIVAIIASVQKRRKQNEQKSATSSGFGTVQPVHTPSAPAARPASMASMLPVTPAAAMRPTVHPHLQPDCETHDAPGSLGAGSLEGKDPCHEEQLTHTRSVQPEQAEAPSGLKLEWSGEAMVRAFVMQEVLTRPCQRRAR